MYKNVDKLIINVTIQIIYTQNLKYLDEQMEFKRHENMEIPHFWSNTFGFLDTHLTWKKCLKFLLRILDFFVNIYLGMKFLIKSIAFITILYG